MDRLPPGRKCVESEEGERALEAFLDAIEQARSIDRSDTRRRPVEEFDTEHFAGRVIAAF